ncbi:MAG: VTC domain-containing protein [Planctomycetota bacterium]|nr:MAG: VTC domain-containing protein [Planctomycetota bacterium]
MTSPLFITRMERKFKVVPRDVPMLLDTLSRNLIRDEFITGRPVVHIATMYFDTPDFAFARKAENTGLPAIKLRAKEYIYRVCDGVETSEFCWIEIKSRYGTTTKKWRFPLAKKYVHELCGEDNLTDAVAKSAKENGADVDQAVRYYECFRAYACECGISPSTVVTYSRHVFGLKKLDLRVTLDSNVRFFRAPLTPYYKRNYKRTPVILEKLGRPISREADAILETKSANGLPDWLWAILNSYKPAQEFSKFVSSSRPLMRKESTVSIP